MPRRLIGFPPRPLSRIVAQRLRGVQFPFMTTPPAPTRPTIAVSMGDPSGIGPEVLVKALADAELRRSARFFIHGLSEPLLEAAEAASIPPFWWKVRAGSALLETAGSHDVVLIDHTEAASECGWSANADRKPTKASGTLSFRFVDDAIAAAKGEITGHPHAHAVVTAPISKHAWAMAGQVRFPGHTEMLADRFKATRSRMAFVAPNLRVILATAHIPLGRITNDLTIGRVHDTIDLGARTPARKACSAMKRSASSRRPSPTPSATASRSMARSPAIPSSMPPLKAATTSSSRCTTTRASSPSSCSPSIPP